MPGHFVHREGPCRRRAHHETPAEEADMARHAHHDGHHRRCCERRGGGGGGRGALVEPAALAALLSSGGHGYDLRRVIGELTGGDVEVDVGGLYRSLRRMEEEGYVTSHWAEGAAGPQRREYEITEAGRELARHWIGHLRERERLARTVADALEGALTTR